MKRRVAWVGLSLLLAVVMIRSLLLTPSATQSRLTAIPSFSHLVYNNESPNGFLSHFPTFGKNGDEFSNAWKTNSVGAQNFFQTLENRPLAVATVAFGGRTKRDSWVVVSELGGSAALALRWRLLLFPPEGVSTSRPYAVWPVWSFEHPSVPDWARVRFSVTESLLICSISNDSHDIYRLLDAADGRVASFEDTRRPR